MRQNLAPACAFSALMFGWAFECALGCAGGAAPPPATANTASAAAAPTSAPAPQPSTEAAAPPAAAASVAAPPHAPAGSEQYDEPGADPATLTTLLGKGALPAFPKATVGEHDCWQTLTISGEARKDYESIVAKCGAATGSIEYVKPAIGKLHSKHDKRDTFVVPIRGGLCYRFFGVADASIKDLDILIEKSGGALVGDDKTNGPVAIIESDKAWCMDTDGMYNFLVEVDGEGQGSYVFGVWARKK